MGAWGQVQNTEGAVTMLADGNGEFAAAMGLEMDGSGFGLGTRSQRYAAIIEDGVVTDLAVESKPGVDVSSGDAVLAMFRGPGHEAHAARAALDFQESAGLVAARHPDWPLSPSP